MKKNRKYKMGEILEGTYGKMEVIKDFLPSPKELAQREETKKVTISLSQTSIDFFKKSAEKYNLQYQKMIRTVLDEYAKQKSNNL